MIIKKLAKLCREHGLLAFSYKDDEMWVGVPGRCMYLLSGIEIIGVDSLKCVFDWSEKQKSKIETMEVNYSSFADRESEDKQFAQPARRTSIGGSDYLVFQMGSVLYFVNAQYLEPIRDKIEGGQCYAFLRSRCANTPAIVIKNGLIDIAVFEPEQMSIDRINTWVEYNEKLISDIKKYEDVLIEDPYDDIPEKDDGQMEIDDYEH